MPRRRRHVDAIHAAEEAVARVTDAAGRWDLGAAEAELARRLRAEPDLLDPDAYARDLLDQLDRERRPKPSQPTLGAMFDKDRWLPLGDRLRVQMGRAQREDLDAWQTVFTDEYVKASAAHLFRLEYCQSRRQAWRPEDADLTDVENRLA